MHSDTGGSSTLWSNALEDLGNSGGSLDATITASCDTLGGVTWIAGFVVQEVDIDPVSVMLGDDWGNG